MSAVQAQASKKKTEPMTKSIKYGLLTALDHCEQLLNCTLHKTCENYAFLSLVIEHWMNHKCGFTPLCNMSTYFQAGTRREDFRKMLLVLTTVNRLIYSTG
jgi:hypothetical protein